jgi:CheY-like chemotaxis protein
VADNGTGMSSDVIDRLFEPFYTTKDEGNGIGLGLAVVYGIVQNHGGFLDVRSQVGKGSTFEIYLPAEESEETKKSPELRSKELAQGHGNVLVVEDEPQVRQMAVRTLQRCGYKVTMAENGLHAISLYQSNKKDIDLIILDMVMPKMGGRECFRRLKEIDPKVKVLCITGYTTEGSYSDLLKEGVLGILEKPLDLYEFAEAAKNAIGNAS